MADDSTDTAFGFIIFILFLALLGYAAGGSTWPSSTAGTTTPKPMPTYTTTTPTNTSTDRSETNIPGGPLESCSGRIIANKTDSSGNGSVNIKVYFSENSDRNCAVGTQFGWPPRTQGRLTVRLRFSDYQGTQWPEYAVVSSQAHTTQVGGVYLDDTYNRCVTASATYAPFTGMDKVSVSTGAIGCN
jgi:hypothetical protein